MCIGDMTWGPAANGPVNKALEPGRVIIVKAGFGFPPAEADIRQVIAEVEGMSAVTSDGVLLCLAGGGIMMTEEIAPVVLSEQAKQIIEKCKRQAGLG
jgi:hypothetical protein